MRRAFSGNLASIPEAPLRFLTPLSRESLQLPSASSPAIQQQAIFTAAQLAAKVRVCLDCAPAPPQSGSHLAVVARGAWRRPAGSPTAPRAPAGPGALTFSAGPERPAPRPQRASEPTPGSAFGSGRRPPPPRPRCRVPALARHAPAVALPIRSLGPGGGGARASSKLGQSPLAMCAGGAAGVRVAVRASGGLVGWGFLLAARTGFPLGTDSPPQVSLSARRSRQSTRWLLTHLETEPSLD